MLEMGATGVGELDVAVVVVGVGFVMVHSCGSLSERKDMEVEDDSRD